MTETVQLTIPFLAGGGAAIFPVLGGIVVLLIIKFIIDIAP